MDFVAKDGTTGKIKLKASLLEYGNTNVENEAAYIRLNVPGIFDEEEE